MRKQTIKRTAALVLAALVLYSGSLPARTDAATTASQAAKTYEPVTDQAQLYVNELAEQPSFDNWKGAKLDISPLGPGTHSWLVIVKQSGESVGYLVIQAKEDGGYKLGEYGIGSRPLFSAQTLSFSVKQLGETRTKKVVEPLYSHPLLTAWKITADGLTTIADAASGELLPVTSANWTKAAEAPLSSVPGIEAPPETKLMKAIILPSFPPYGKMPWLTDKPLKLKADSHRELLSAINNKEQLRYTAELFFGEMLYVWSVVGYSKWDNSQVYVALEADDDGTSRRYIPLPLLLALGHFYR
jgi:hypothetical protein